MFFKILPVVSAFSDFAYFRNSNTDFPISVHSSGACRKQERQVFVAEVANVRTFACRNSELPRSRSTDSGLGRITISRCKSVRPIRREQFDYFPAIVSLAISDQIRRSSFQLCFFLLCHHDRLSAFSWRV